MKFLAFLSLLALGAAEDVVDIAAVGDVIIYDRPFRRGQSRAISVNGICQDLSPPHSSPARGIQSIEFEVGQGENCELYNTYNCRGHYTSVYYEDMSELKTWAKSIRCSKN